jgi:hypothetical protein
MANHPRSHLVVPHDPDCGAVRACTNGKQIRRWRTPWWLPNDFKTYYRDSMFRENGGRTRWVELRCNNTTCGAKCVVLADDIEELAPVFSEGSDA